MTPSILEQGAYSAGHWKTIRILLLPLTIAALIAPVQASLAKGGKTMHAIVEQDCAPWDGPAFAVWIPAKAVGGREDSWIYLRIWQSPTNSLGRFTFPDKTMRKGAVMFFTGLKSPDVLNVNSQPHQSLTGSVHLTRVSRTQNILGELDLRTESNIHLQGKFEAKWNPRTMIPCG